MIRAALTLARADLPGAGLMAALLLVLLAPPLVAYEPAWEAAASLGYTACFALIVTLRLAPAARHATRSYRFAVHRAAGLACIASVAGSTCFGSELRSRYALNEAPDDQRSKSDGHEH